MPSVLLVIFAPDPWPPVRRVELAHGERFLIALTTEGRFLVNAARPGASADEALTFTSQRVSLTPRAPVAVILRWEDDRVDLRLNGAGVLDASSEDVLVLPPPKSVEEAPRSIDHPDVATVCASAMGNRSRRWGQAQLGPERRVRGIREELDRLRDASAGIRDLLGAIEAGKNFHLATLQAALREMVVFNGKNYQPVLLRCAARLGLPLPVYALPNTPPPPVLNEAISQWRGEEVGIVARLPGQILVDFQDWLGRRAFRTEISTTRSLTINELIRELASTSGGGHYDPGSPLVIDDLADITLDRTPVYASLLTQVAVTACDLADFVQARGSAAQPAP